LATVGPVATLPPNMSRPTTMPATLALEDGAVFNGYAFGAIDQAQPLTGEVVFNTSMTGYQEILTDPSYRGQIVAMTYPHIGNYGTNRSDTESQQIQVAGFIVRDLCQEPSNFRATDSLDAYLKAEGVVGIGGIDTRALTRRLRIHGSMRGALGTGQQDPVALVDLARKSPAMTGQNLAQQVSTSETESWTESLDRWKPIQGEVEAPNRTLKVVAIDCGAKTNILRHLVERQCQVTVVPHDTPAEAILDLGADGLFVSNGPGDPAPVESTIQTLTTLHGKLPTFGICLGHQLLGLSLGADTFKLPFGHRGGNQPVRNIATGKVEITSQNHGFAVDIDSLEKAGVTPTHVNCNDNTLEGFRHADLPIFAVQYHPEASPGPHDATYLFDCFIQMMLSGQSPTAEQMDIAQKQRSAV
jgi:carbamoyl-phosphate synthase small subunit